MEGINRKGTQGLCNCASTRRLKQAGISQAVHNFRGRRKDISISIDGGIPSVSKP